MAKTKKPMTLEDFAGAIHEDYLAIRKDMAAREDIQAIQKELGPIKRDVKTLTAHLQDVREDVKHISDVMVSKADLANTLGDELAKSAYARRVEDLQTRVRVLEEKLGIKPAHRAA